MRGDGKKILLAGVGLLVGSLVFIGYRLPHGEPVPPSALSAIAADNVQRPNSPRPDFSLADLAGSAQPIAQWDGKVIALNFWATWCTPCLREMPTLNELHARHAGRGLQLVGIAVEENLDAVRQFLEKQPVGYPMLAGYEDAIEVATAYGNTIGALPYTAVIDRNGILVYTQRGEISAEEFERVIAPLL